MSVLLLVIMVSLIINIYSIKFSIIDLYNILEDNSKTNDVVVALDEEFDAFEDYINGASKGTTTIEIREKSSEAQYAIDSIPIDYKGHGIKRYQMICRLKNSYEVYEKKRESFLALERRDERYIKKQYELINMQEYIRSYANDLMNYTITQSNEEYQAVLPKVLALPIIIIIITGALVIGIFYITRGMNNAISIIRNEEINKLNTEKQLESMKFDMLKNQVNPHFLFNTLNAINGMTQLEEAEVSGKMTMALSDLFRYNLKTTDQEVPLYMELKVLSDYIYLQEMRFGSRITFEVKCEIDEKLYMMPSFTLQPLVENALVHGLSSKEEGGTIRVRIFSRNNRLLVTVGDDGLGMDEETIRLMMKDIAEESNHRIGIGLGNVAKRINGMYKDGTFNIYSKENRGTAIVIDLPLIDIDSTKEV